MAKYSVDYDGDLSTTDDRVSYGSFDAAVGGLSDRGFGSYGVQDNRRGGGGNLGSFDVGGRDDPGGRAGAGWGALNDARQVGGGGFFGNIAPGRIAGGLLGGLFGGPIGGLIGAGIGGRLTGQNWGYTDAQGNRVSGLRDRFDGGGRGRAGDRFEGGLLSGIGNSLGIRPAGYRDRQEALAAQAAQAAAMGGTGVVGGRGGGGGIPPVGSTDLTGTSAALSPSGYVPIDIAGPVRDLPAVQPAPIPMSAQPGMMSPPPIDFGVTPLASQRYLDQFGMAELAPTNPAMLPRAQPSMSDLQDFLSGVPDNPMTGVQAPSLGPINLTPGVGVGSTDPITFRNNLSAANQAFGRPSSVGAAPFTDTQSYRAGMAPGAMSQSPMAGQYAPVFSGFNVMPGVDVGAPARTPPSMYQPNPITSTRGAGTVPATSPALPPSPYGGQSFDPVAARTAAQRMRDEVQRRRMNLGVSNPLVYNN